MKNETLAGKPAEDPLSSRALIKLNLYSTCIFVLLALAMQFLLTLEMAVLLKIAAYPFQYNLFSISYSSEGDIKWSETAIYFVFCSGPLLLSLAGLRLLAVMSTLKHTGWKIKLILAWLAFLLVNALPCGIVSGALFFDGIGVAFHAMIDNFFIRALIGLVVLFILIYFTHFWQLQFLASAWSPAFIENSDNHRIYLKNVFIKPWIYGVIILLFFNWPFNNFYWPAFLLSLGYLSYNTRQLFRFDRFPKNNLKDKQFTVRFQIMGMAAFLVLLWTLNFMLNYFGYHFFD